MCRFLIIYCSDISGRAFARYANSFFSLLLNTFNCVFVLVAYS